MLQGPLKITEVGEVEVLTVEADGLDFMLTDGVDLAHNGMIYFIDASYIYSFAQYMLDILEGMPHGRFFSFDPLTQKKSVLVHHLYFANRVAVPPDQTSVIFCETIMYALFSLIISRICNIYSS